MLGTTFLLAIRSILRHKLRSFLTTLGIIIGVAAVVTISPGMKPIVNVSVPRPARTTRRWAASAAGRRPGAWAAEERMGREPAINGSPGRRESEATSVIFF